ncbi:unnamed protein product [Prorocentrum cordatum]|uniref:Uncharacterized protein n=1 Tax=Prorocentrum cordatum TaxID=2364126 RepID=A0ABN9V8T5_9DINO|nr:unnamed protein product [Polarella glacialis]
MFHSCQLDLAVRAKEEYEDKEGGRRRRRRRCRVVATRGRPARPAGRHAAPPGARPPAAAPRAALCARGARRGRSSRRTACPTRQSRACITYARALTRLRGPSTDWVPSPGVLATPGPSPGEVQLPPGGGMRGGGAAPLASDAAAALPPPERRVGKHAHQRGGRARPFGKRQGRGGDGAPPPVLRPLQAAAAARRRPRCYSARASALERDRVWEQLWSGVVATVSVSPPRRPPTGCLALPSFLA